MGLCVAPFATHLSTKYFHTSRNAKEVSEVEIAISRELSCELNLSILLYKISHTARGGAHARSQSRLQTPLPIFGKWRAKHVDRHSSRICKLATKWKRIVPDITQVSDQVIKPRICFLYKRMRNNSTPQRAPLPASLADSGQPRSLFSMLSLLSVD